MPIKKQWYIIKKYKVLPRNIENQAGELSRLCFNHYKETKEQKKIDADKFYNNKAIITVLALENNRVIGRAKVIKRDISYKGVKIVLGGLGGVCTLPEKRRKGVAALVVRIAFDELINQDCDIAYLCTDINNPYKVRLYNRVGFVSFGKPHQYQGKSGKIYIDHDAMIASVNSKSKFDLVMKGSEIFDIGHGNW